MKSFVRRILVIAVLLLVPGALWAQETRVTGQVMAEDVGQPLAGVQIMVKGTTVGTLSDGNGNFAIRVPAGATTLVFSFIGYRTLEREITGPVVSVSLSPEAIGLEGITVTALGITREKRSLGYSVQNVSGEQITDVPKLNLVDALHGHVAGVQITNSNNPGGSARIVIRGASSITGNNQPLFIVDGIPIDNSARGHNGGGNDGYGGYDYGNRAQDLDPNNIESISVLKGPNAAALYGSRAANGAVVITTKRGHDGAGLGITATVGTTFETPLKLPSYQNLYGQGFGGEFWWVDGAYGGVNDGADESWGPRLDGRLICQFDSPGAGTDNCTPTPWVAHPNNVRDFFDTGVTTNTTVSLARSDERSNVRLSATRMQMSGMYPSNRIERLGGSLAGSVKLTDRLSAEGTINYTQNEARNRPGTGYDGTNAMQQFVWFGRQVDIQALRRNYACDLDDSRGPCQLGNTFYNWNYSYHDNPFSIARENRNDDTTDRVMGHLALTYGFTDWLSATVRSGTDYFDEKRKRTYAWGHFGGEFPKGGFADETLWNRETNTDVLVTAMRNVTPDLTMTVNAGANRRDEEYKLNHVSVTELSVPGTYTLANAGVTPVTDDFNSKRRVNSLYGAANLNYRGYLSVDVTGRNDWSSTLPEDNNSYFYPSISSALVFTDALDLDLPLLSSGKVRASWTRVGNDADPYQTAAVLTGGTRWGSIPAFTINNTIANPGLKPEETTAWEVGADLGFLDERLGFVATYYDNKTVNQIMGVQISRASGFTNQVLNAGEVRNRGVELLLNAAPIRRPNGLRWDLTLNWAKNNSEVADLYGDLQTLVLGTYWSLNIEARKGEPYGTLFGAGYLRNDAGAILVDDDGFPLRDPNLKVLGNYNPDWTGGLLNRFSYRSVDLSVLVDMQQGGDIFSVTNYFGNYAGVLETSIPGRENDTCDPGVLVKGVRQSDGQPNTTRVCPEDYYGGLYSIHESSIYDASYVKLREVKLGYQLPRSVLGRLGFAGATVAVVARNLFLWTDVPNIDPETAFSAGNVQGIEFGQFPSARSIGFTVTVRP